MRGIFFFAKQQKGNPVCERRVDLLVCSLPLHRHSYIGFILAFASSFHNKQKVKRCFSECGEAKWESCGMVRPLQV